MTRLVAARGKEPWLRRLYLPAYRVAEAARYAQVSPQTVSHWHKTNEKRARVLSTREAREALSYLQLVEVAFVAVLRKMGVTLQRIRNAREYLAQQFNCEYPFAQVKFKTEGAHILKDLREFGVENVDGVIVKADAGGQLCWADFMVGRFTEFDYENDLAVKWHPAGRASPVVIDPQVSFGAPTIQGIPTWALRGRWDAGEDINDIAADFGLSPNDVEQGLSFENGSKRQIH